MSELNSDAEKLRHKIFQRLSAFERQSDNGTHMNIPVHIGSGILWETSQDIRLFLKYLQDHYEKPRTSPLPDLTDDEWLELYFKLCSLKGQPSHNPAKLIANAARKFMEGLR